MGRTRKPLINFDGWLRTKKNIYDHLCATLAIYEDPDSFDEEDRVTEEDLYNLLVEVTKNWDFMMSSDYA